MDGVVVDGLSRRDTESSVSLMALSAPSNRLFDDLHHEFDTTPVLHALRDDTRGARGDKRCVVDDLVVVNSRVYMPPASPSKQEVIANATAPGHERVQKTPHRLRVDFFLLVSRYTV
jgi:hypothetical protein